MPIHVHDTGAWRQVHTVWTNQSGVWVKVKKVSANVSGTWRQVHGGDVVVSDPINVSESNPGGLASAGVTFGSDGDLSAIGSGSIPAGQWWSAEPQTGIGADYRVRCVSLNSGTWDNQAASVGTWVRMDVSRSWSILVTAMTSPSSDNVSAEFQIAPYPSGAVLVQFTVIASVNN